MADKWKTHWQAPASKTAAERIEALKLVLRFAEGKAAPQTMESVLRNTFGRYGGARPSSADWEAYRKELLDQLWRLARGREAEFESPSYWIHISGGAGGLPAYDGHGVAL